MRNMFTLSEIIEATNGKLIDKRADSSEVIITGVSKDTRTVASGNLYVALVGERFDGNDFCDKAIEAGAGACLVSRENAVPEGSVGVLVDDTLIAYGLIAKAYRMKLGAKVIAVTGSVGKTTTREMIAKAVSAGRKVWSTKSNQNNEIGLPTTILEAPEDTEVLVLEMGMRLLKEISYLTNIACPDIAVITNVGYCHIERLGSRENIRIAKEEIVEGLTEGGALIVNGDDEFLMENVASVVSSGCKLVTISAGGTADVAASNISVTDSGMNFDVNGVVDSVQLSVNGVHNIRNSLVALACCMITGVDAADAAKSLGEYKEMAGRGEVIRTNKYVVINDAYNASPESMAAAFDNLDIVGNGRKVAVLGGILELGDYAAMLHEEVGRSCGRHNFDVVIVTGDNRDDFKKGFGELKESSKLVMCEDTEDVKAHLLEVIQDNDTILFKASHAFGFEKLATEIAELGNL